VADNRGTLDVLALTELRESMGGDQEFLLELIDEFLEDAPRQLESLRVAATLGDAEAARRAAHTLKGNGRTFGAGAFASLCQQVEAAAGGGDPDFVIACIDEINESWERFRTELVAVRKGRG
jgi:HPt (histidine-containing phosphotransfer) domain-containing protein